jgi:hypothetical protein
MLVKQARRRTTTEAIEALITSECFISGIVNKDEKIIGGGG